MKAIQQFVEYFESQGHIQVDSSSLLPKGDTSVLFTTAGMQQFKSYYLGTPSPYGNRVISVQKCLRVDDIDEVGDETHNTFFEMLGNFSFNYPSGEGSYFKSEAIKFGYELIAEKLGMKIDYVTIFAGDNKSPKDTETLSIWQDLALEKGIVLEIRELDRGDNFWGPTGVEGPCGPTTEIFVNGVEVWNIVFNQYYSKIGGELETLPQQGVDTGGGLERIVTQLEGVKSVYDSSIFTNIMADLRSEFVGQTEAVYRVIFDHIRASTFLLSEGVVPSNKEQGYILRRLLRKVLSLTSSYDRPLELIFFTIDSIVDIYQKRYPDLNVAKDNIKALIQNEYALFQDALSRGMKYADKMLKKKRVPHISGEEAFLLASTYGLSPEVLKLQGLSFDEQDFENYKSEHQTISRAGATKKFGGHGLILDNGELKAANEEELVVVTRLHSATHLLNQALREVLGVELEQRGSDITAERTRFDFSFDRKLTSEEIKAVEDKVNNYIQQGADVVITNMTLEEAKKSGALYLGNRNYPEFVDVYNFGDISKELCGGPHIKNTKEIGQFKIKKEEAVSRGVRRIRGIII
jgi:alanyl-tRNA synthetase